MRVAAVIVLLVACLSGGGPPRPVWELTLTQRAAVQSMAATASGQAWLIGKDGALQRWDGRAWAPAGKPPRFWSDHGSLVTSPAGDDLWLFGGEQPLQWQGRWVSRPFPRGEFAAGPQAVAARDRVWVGEQGGPEDCVCVGIRYWDGTQWRDVATGGDQSFDTQFTKMAPPWLVNHEGMLRWENGRRRQVPPPVTSFGCRSWEGYAIERLTSGPGGAWAVARVARPEASWCLGHHAELRVLLRWDGAAWRQVELSLDGTGVAGLAVDAGGGLWLAANPGGRPYVLRWEKGRWRRAVLPRGTGIARIAPEPGTGRLWVQAQDGPDTLIYRLTATTPVHGG
ncbi:hypothetical protein ACFWY5_30510 [Nonomuraea sp. NPDC059007]|uniref:hypothetical protein n=1 Tax=Nonomuraea sp. NPDC059007 TaxID=3346692 RepID=UPI00369D074B